MWAAAAPHNATALNIQKRTANAHSLQENKTDTPDVRKQSMARLTSHTCVSLWAAC